MLYKHKCSPCSVLRCTLHIILNYVEKVTLDVGGNTESVFTSCMCNILSQTLFTKKGVTAQQVYKVKQWCQTIWTWRRRWDGAYVNCDLINIITYYVKSASQNRARRAFVFIKHIKNVLWLIASLDKTLIHRLVLCIALWSCTETIILTSNRLESIEVHSMDKCFHQKQWFIFDWRKEYIHILDNMGVSKLSGHFHLKVN